MPFTVIPVVGLLVAAASAQITSAPTTTTHSAKPANTLTYSATYTYGGPGSLPDTTETNQYGTNNCGTTSSQTSMCQNVFINSVEDFCLWGPPYSDGKNATIGDTETPDYVQVTGWGDLTKIGIPNGDYGGELDPHSWDGNGNPIGGLVFGNSYGKMQQYHEWTNFQSYNQFCIRACNPAGPNPAGYCQHIYDLQGCNWNMPGNYDEGYFEDCLSDSSLPMGVYGTSTWYQSIEPTPTAHPIPPSSSCVRVASLTSASIAPTSVSGEFFSTGFSFSSASGSTITFIADVATITEGASLTTSNAKSTGTGSGAGASGTGSSAHSAGVKLSAGAGPVLAAVTLALGIMVGGLMAF